AGAGGWGVGGGGVCLRGAGGAGAARAVVGAAQDHRAGDYVRRPVHRGAGHDAVVRLKNGRSCAGADPVDADAAGDVGDPQVLVVRGGVEEGGLDLEEDRAGQADGTGPGRLQVHAAADHLGDEVSWGPVG